jgi:4-hydroxybutyryl-CoA dehydratase/vinylacetyl-CoA-Delta-isomerase
MPLKTPEEYVASIRARKPMKIWFRGEKIKDPIKHPALRSSVETIKRIYELAHHPKFKELLTIKSHLTGNLCNFYTSPLTKQEDAIQKTRLARSIAEILGCCTFKCTGSEAISGLYPTTYEMDKALGTDYHERLKKWLIKVQDEDLTAISGLLRSARTGSSYGARRSTRRVSYWPTRWSSFRQPRSLKRASSMRSPVPSRPTPRA